MNINNDTEKPYGTYLRYKCVSKRSDKDKIELKIIYLIRNYAFTKSALVNEINKTYNMTENEILEIYENIKIKYPHLKRFEDLHMLSSNKDFEFLPPKLKLSFEEYQKNVLVRNSSIFKYSSITIDYLEKLNDFKKLVADKLNIELSILSNMSINKINNLIEKSSIDVSYYSNKSDEFVDWLNNISIKRPCDFKKDKQCQKIEINI